MPSRYINRDLSLIEFFRRVLEEAQDQSQPLLERLKFISILGSNLDEFFMIRVSGLKDRLGRETGVSADGIPTPELLKRIRMLVKDLIDEQMHCLREDILPALANEGIVISPYSSLPDRQRIDLDNYFQSSVYPVLTPQAVDPTHPFPYISGGSINIGLMVRPKLIRRVARAYETIGHEFFVRLKIPPFVPRFVPVDGSPGHFVLIEDLVVENIRRLVPEASPEACHLFRITRDADIDLREAETEDLLETMEENLRLRRFGGVVRLEVSESMPPEMSNYLESSLEISPEDVYTVNGPLDTAEMMDIYKLDRPELKDPPLTLSIPPAFAAGRSAFDVIKDGDVLLHHPYMPYSIITDFIKEAVEDPDVLAIKMCLYRIGARSPIAPLLIEASERGKQVTALIEIKARFDEENNIEWAKRFEEAGVHVIYGLLGLKTHCKTTLIVRREEERLVRYVHLATGNYNPETSAFYTDLGLLTTNEAIGEDATELFNYLTVYSLREPFKELVVAPVCLRERMLELIGREAENARAGRPSRIIAKMNRLADFEIVNALYDASQAGVSIDLVVRGVCTLRPGVPGLSENIRVRSIVGQLLEHSRVYYFENGGEPLVFTGSADWMPRNLDRRVEVLAPVHDPELRVYLRNEFLEAYLRDNVKARLLFDDGTFHRVERGPGDEEFNSQTSFQNMSNVIPFEVIEHSRRLVDDQMGPN
jgi:polyphosphate kinase